MINWDKGLSEEQQVLLNKLLEEESKIEPKWYSITCGEEECIKFGKWLPKNKLVRERDSGYTYYLEVDGILYKYSAFSYKIKEIENRFN